MSEQPPGQGWRGDLGREQYQPSYGADPAGRPASGADPARTPLYQATQGQPPWESAASGAGSGGPAAGSPDPASQPHDPDSQPHDPAGQSPDPAGQPPGAAAGDATSRAARAGRGGPLPQLPIAEARRFLNALFDFGFTSFVTPKIIKGLYFLIVIVAGLGALAFGVAMLAANLALGLAVLLIGAPLCFLVVTALYRITLEFFMVIFRMAEDIRVLRDRGPLS